MGCTNDISCSAGCCGRQWGFGMRFIDRLLVVTTVLMFTALALAYVSNKRIEDHVRRVFSTCESSRVTGSPSEQACADAQFKYKLEYLCDANNNSPDNYCWVERNNDIEKR